MSDTPPPPPGYNPSNGSWQPPGPPSAVGPGGFPQPPTTPPGPGFAAQQPAAPFAAQTGDGPPDNGLVWAILATILCCLPFGIAAIVYSTQVDTKWYRGDQAGARRSAQLARNWTYAAVGVGLVTIVVFWVLPLVLTLVSGTTTTGY